MRGLRSTLIAALGLFVVYSTAAAQDSPGVRPPDGFVPSADVARKIAEAVLFPIYGEENIEKQRPYAVHLDGDVWTLEGTLAQPANGIRLGGVFTIRISRSTGEILYLQHTR